MLTDLQPANSWTRRYRYVVVSVSLHLAVLAMLVFHNPRIIEVRPTWLAFGEGTHTYQITYIPPGDDESMAETPPSRLPALATQPHPRPKPKKATLKPKEIPQPLDHSAEGADSNIRAGSALGTVLEGPITGHEVRVALPLYPEPQVDRADLPRDLVGDVVIEVTIDAQGNVVETKVVQAIGRGIDEKIAATIRRRHYQPATLDGTPVASKQDVHFHFPS